MGNRYECIPALRNALNEAINGGKYDFLQQADYEGDFITLITDNLQGSDLEPFSKDIELIIYWYMCMTDERDFLMDKLDKTNKEKN